MIIRKAQPSDAQALSAIGAASFKETFQHLYAAEDLNAFLAKSHSEQAYLNLFTNPKNIAWLVEDETDVVGYAVAGVCTLPVPHMPKNSGELGRLYLLERVQGNGLGKSLLDLAMDFLTTNFDHIFLSVYAENIRAQEIYQSRGFRKVHDYFYMVGNHADPEWIMKWIGLPKAEV
ncbi:MAG: GNAT family N-acetyltransferase [Pseudomonadota bacterium]